MDPWYKKIKGQITVVITAVVLLLLLIWSQLLRELSHEKENTLQSAIQRNENLAISWEQYTIRTLQNADEVLKLAAWEYAQNGSAIDFRRLYQEGIIDASSFCGLAIFNEKGNIVASDLSGLTDSDLNFSDREYFIYLKTHSDELYMSEPLISRTINETVIILSRRINNPDGSFAGVIALQMRPSVFTRFYARANMRTNDILSIIAPNGVTYARRTGNRESFGENIRKSPLFKEVARSPVGDYAAPDAIHDVFTYFSYRKLEHFPVIATVGTAQTDIFASYIERKKQMYTYGVAISLLLILFCILICIYLMSRKKAIHSIHESEARYRSVFENSHDAVLLFSPERTIKAINGSAQRLFQLKPGEGIGFSAEQLYRHTIPELKLPIHDDLGEDGKKEILFTTKAGASFTGEITYSTFLNANGRQQLVMNIRDISSRKQMEQQLLSEQKKYERKLTRQIILAQEREREAIGHELHDNINQILTTVKLYLELVQNQHETREQLLPKAFGLVQNCIQEIRTLSHELSSPTLGKQTLVDSIKSLIDQVSASSSLHIQFNYDNYQFCVDKDQHMALYRILQEQLTNIIKHAGATTVSIDLFQDNQYTGITVRDNGKGFNPEKSRLGIGLNNIKSRASAFGGMMKVKSVPGNGCTIEVLLPISDSIN